MKKLYGSILKSLIIGVFILKGSLIISRSITKEEETRYQIISHGDEIIIFDTRTGDYYSKFNALNEGPTNWTKEESPFESD